MPMRIVIALLAGLSFGSGLAFAEGYLPLLGPGPLRFARDPSPPPALTNSVSLASAELPSTNPPSPAVLEAATLPDPQTNAVVTVARSPLPAGFDTNDFPSFPMPGTNGAPPGPIAPQMLLQFFHDHSGNTNDANSAVVGPMLFIPPQPGPRSPSKAVYSSP